MSRQGEEEGTAGTIPGGEHPEVGQKRLKGRVPGEKKDPELRDGDVRDFGEEGRDGSFWR